MEITLQRVNFKILQPRASIHTNKSRRPIKNMHLCLIVCVNEQIHWSNFIYFFRLPFFIQITVYELTSMFILYVTYI